MNKDAVIQAIEEKINGLIAGDKGCFLVEIQLVAGNNIKVFIDADGGLAIDKLVKYNRGLYNLIEESGMFPGGDFALEISSPGLDEPLRLHRQYVKNIGRNIEVVQKDGIKKEGKLIFVNETDIVFEEEKGKGKKKETIKHTVLFENIKATTIQIKF
jgi:ribosome maturation factor RimP